MLRISAEEFRRKLAGLESTERNSDAENQEMMKLGIDLVIVLRNVFGDSLDRKTLWHRIGNGISVAAHKCAGSAEKFIAETLDYVKADESAVVVNDKLKAVHKTVKGQSKDWQMSFIRTCLTYKNLLMLEAREIATDRFVRKEYEQGRVSEGGKSNE